MEYILEKVTRPTFTLKTNMEVIYHSLLACICDTCKTTFKEATHKNWEVSTDQDDFLPDNFYLLNIKERVEMLLNTRCGSEFVLNIIEDDV